MKSVLFEMFNADALNRLCFSVVFKVGNCQISELYSSGTKTTWKGPLDTTNLFFVNLKLRLNLPFIHFFITMLYIAQVCIPWLLTYANLGNWHYTSFYMVPYFVSIRSSHKLIWRKINNKIVWLVSSEIKLKRTCGQLREYS